MEKSQPFQRTIERLKVGKLQTQSKAKQKSRSVKAVAHTQKDKGWVFSACMNRIATGVNQPIL